MKRTKTLFSSSKIKNGDAKHGFLRAFNSMSFSCGSRVFIALPYQPNYFQGLVFIYYLGASIITANWAKMCQDTHFSCNWQKPEGEGVSFGCSLSAINSCQSTWPTKAIEVVCSKHFQLILHWKQTEELSSEHWLFDFVGIWRSFRAWASSNLPTFLIAEFSYTGLKEIIWRWRWYHHEFLHTKTTVVYFHAFITEAMTVSCEIDFDHEAPVVLTLWVPLAQTGRKH